MDMSDTILDNLVQNKVYQLKTDEQGYKTYYDPMYITAQEKKQQQDEQKMQQQSAWQNFKDIFNEEAEIPEPDYAPDLYSIVPPTAMLH